MRYGTICADPPWPYDTRGPSCTKEARPNSYGTPLSLISSSDRYGHMSIEEICDLKPEAEKEAHLYLWVTNSFMQEGFQVVKAWGFDFKTILTWVKVKPDGTPSMKAGYYYRGATEHVLFATRGNLRLSGPPHPTVWLSPRLPHSVKPDCFYRTVEEQSPAPYLEMFARRARPHWYAWGNQVEHNLFSLSEA